MAAPGFKLTPEFEAAVSNGNHLRTRIMLKDSMVVDPTGKQFGQMLDYAKRKLPDIIVSHDGEPLEENQAKWDLELMNRELSQLVNNFSNERIGHLWRVIRKVRGNDIRRLESQNRVQPYGGTPSLSFSISTRAGSDPFPNATASSGLSASEKKQNRAHALGAIQKAGKDIEQSMMETDQGKTWSQIQVAQIEQAARKIVAAAKRYKENK